MADLGIRPEFDRYDEDMCSSGDWDRLRRRVDDAVGSEDLRSFMSETAARVEALIDEMKLWTCASENVDWMRPHDRRSRPDWVV